MLASQFAEPLTLVYGAATGLVFGFLLQRGGVTRFQVILGQFLLKDFTMLKIMLSAVVTGAVGIYGMRALGMDVALHIKTATILGNAVGGVIFGVGMAILGFCPGTGIGAIADGARHAIPGLIGMLVGAALYARAYPWVNDNILSVGDEGKLTLDTVTGLSPWWLIAGVAVFAVVVLNLIERLQPRSR